MSDSATPSGASGCVSYEAKLVPGAERWPIAVGTAAPFIDLDGPYQSASLVCGVQIRLIERTSGGNLGGSGRMDPGLSSFSEANAGRPVVPLCLKPTATLSQFPRYQG